MLGLATRRSPPGRVEVPRNGGRESGLGPDAIVVPGILLLIAADLLIRDPSRELAWRLLHELRVSTTPAWLEMLIPAHASFDRDPLGLLLAGVAVALSITYLGAAVAGSSVRLRAGIVGIAMVAMVLFPTCLYVSVGTVTGRPFGQDGGVVQLPLAMDRLLSGQSPYGADYTETILGREAHASAFWRSYGENPILHHHAYLPGTDLAALPFYLVARALDGSFDARLVSSLALILAVFLAAGLFPDPPRRLAAAAVVGLNPLVYWHQAFGANDLVFVAALLASARAGQVRRMGWAGAFLGLACAMKQLAWPFAPFLLVHWASVSSFRDFARAETWNRVRRPFLSGLFVFLALALPVMVLDPWAFWNDLMSYNLGIGPDSYPLGGTPGFGVGNFIIYFGWVSSLREAFPFQYFLPLFVPLGFLLFRAQLRWSGLGAAFMAGSVALLAAVFFSRVAHANYLIAFATLLPLGVMLEGFPPDVAMTPLTLLGLATTFASGGFLRSAFEAARDARLFARGPALLKLISPQAGESLTRDPFGIAFAALAAGLALAYAVSGMLGAGPRARGALVLLAVVILVVMPTALLSWISGRTGLVLAEDRWVLETRIEATQVARGNSPYAAVDSVPFPGREAWSSSFSQRPPQTLDLRTPTFPPGASILALATLKAGFPDPRAVLLLSLFVLLVTAFAALSPAERPLAWTSIVLLPPSVLGVIFGSGQLPWLAATGLALAAARRGNMLASGLLAGMACAIDLRAIIVVLFAPRLRTDLLHGSPVRRFVIGAVGSGLLLLGPLAFLNPTAVAAVARHSDDLDAGAGLVNIAAYEALESSMPLHELLALSPWIAGVMAFLFMWRIPRAPSLIAAFWLMVTLFFAKDATGFALGPPLVLVVLSATALTGTAGFAWSDRG